MLVLLGALHGLPVVVSPGKAHVGVAHATICFIRHGQSEWNAANRFTGWTDVDLTEVGRAEAAVGGQVLRAEGLTFDRAFTSELQRAQETLAIVLHASEQHSVPTMRHWRLNERHYGRLQGRSKHDCIRDFGMEQVRVWRNSYDVPPPCVSTHSPAFPGNDPKYESVSHDLLPTGECLRDTLERCLPFWEEHVVPEVRAGHNILIAAHGHSIRALVKHLENISDEGIRKLSIPNGIPLVYQVDKNAQPLRQHRMADSEITGTFLGDEERIRAADWMLAASEIRPATRTEE